MSVFYGRALTIGGGGISVPKFTYTGTYEYIDDGNGNWRIKFLTSGVFTPLKDMVIEVFLVGAGGGGGRSAKASSHPTVNLCSSGGGGGFTKTVRSVILTKDTAYEIVVGVGGAPGVDGGSTSAFNATVSGGKKGDSITGDSKGVAGGAGGSGGGGANTSAGSGQGAASGGTAGSDGSSVTSGSGGTGPGTTTREFGEAAGDLYSGGGGGTYYSMYMSKPATGGDGGGAKGKESAADNTGGGGGGGDGSGGSGIVVIRNHKEVAA